MDYQGLKTLRTEKILIIKLSAIGDVIHTLPALNLLHHLCPTADITWLVEEEAAPLLEGYPFISSMIISKRKRWFLQLKRPSLWISTLEEICSFFKEIRSKNYDLIIDFQGLLKSGILVFLCRGARKAGFDRTRELSYLFLNERYPAGTAERHAVEKNVSLVKLVTGHEVSVDILKERDDCFFIAIGEKEKREVALFFRKNKIAINQPLVMVNPMTRWETKRWEAHKFAQLADSMIEKHGVQVVFCGSDEDFPLIENQ